jgi:carbamoyl-phosphate synthase large subunit
MKALTVLVSSAGRRVHLLQCFRQDAAVLGINLRVLAADLRPDLSAACHQADQSFSVPRCTSPDYLTALEEICRRERVAVVVPTIDPELGVLARATDRFAAWGTRLVTSSPEVNALAGDKMLTAERLAAAGIRTPRTLSLGEYRKNPRGLPGRVIAKPCGGSSSVGLVRPAKLGDLADLPQDTYIVQELLQGREYTVNVFFDSAGKLHCAVPHERLEVRNGEVSKGRTERVPSLIEAAHKLALVLPGARGPLCFQAFVGPDGSATVFEINARFGGGFPLAHRAGARFSQWLLEEALGLPCSANNDWREGVTMLRYDAAVFLDP